MIFDSQTTLGTDTISTSILQKRTSGFERLTDSRPILRCRVVTRTHVCMALGAELSPTVLLCHLAHRAQHRETVSQSGKPSSSASSTIVSHHSGHLKGQVARISTPVWLRYLGHIPSLDFYLHLLSLGPHLTLGFWGSHLLIPNPSLLLLEPCAGFRPLRSCVYLLVSKGILVSGCI